MGNLNQMVEFLNRVLPAQPLYAAVVYPKGASKPQQTVLPSIQTLANTLCHAANAGHDTFFGLASFAQGWHPHPQGKLNAAKKIKKVFRTQQNSAYLKSMFLDIDVGNESTKYHTQDEAQQAVIEFCSVVGLPQPLIVSSGGGLHVYWPFREAIPTKAWRAIASCLAGVVNAYGLKVDPARTQDSASILRPTDTYNFKSKYDTPMPIVQLQRGVDSEAVDFIRAIKAYMVQHGIKPVAQKTSAIHTAKVPQGYNAVFAQAMGHVMDTTEARDKDPRRIISLCKQVREASTEAEPVWYAMMTIMKCCKQGEAVARILSARDPRHSDSEFKAKYDYVESLDGGPSLCTTFDRECPGKCDTCPYRGKIKSPAELGRTMPEDRPAAQAEPTAISIAPMSSAMPEQTVTNMHLLQHPQYEVVEGEGIYFYEEIQQKGGLPPLVERTKILSQCLYLMSAQIITHSFTSSEVVYIWMITESGSPSRQARMTAEDLKSNTNLRKWCINNQVLATPGNEVKEYLYMQAYLAQVQRKIPQILMRDQFGWTESKSESGATTTGFIVGNKLVSGNMPVTQVGLTNALESMADDRLHTRGTLEEWKAIPAFYKKHNLVWGQFGLCLGFGATLMQFAPGAARNGIVNFWSSDSGTGKTTLQRAINSIWGMPEKLLLNVQSTNNSRYHIMGWLCNLPICINEVTKMSESEMSDTLFQISEGEEKERMEKGGGLQYSGHWNTTAVMSANHAVLDRLAALLQQRDAEIKRVIDVEIHKCEAARHDAIAMERAMERNYGMAGIEFMQRMLDRDDLFQAIPNMIDKWCERNSGGQDERFWNVTVATAVIAGRIAKAFGIIDFDMDAIEKFALAEIKRMRNSLAGSKSSGSDLLGDLLNDKMRDMLVVSGAERRVPVDPSLPTHMDNYIKRVPVGTLDIRIELDTNTVYVRKNILHQWCSDNSVTTRGLLSDLALNGIYDPQQGTANNRGHVQMRMSKGVPTIPSTPSRCYKLVLGDESGLDRFAAPVSDLTNEDITGGLINDQY